jgi:hypothetical protein
MIMELGEAPEEDQSISGSERYFCPFPGCKRSFAELWRLKVHYRCACRQIHRVSTHLKFLRGPTDTSESSINCHLRRAPPDIRGSGKERGHGTELTHCPK